MPGRKRQVLQRVTRKVMSRNRDYSKGVARAKAKSIISRRSVGAAPKRSAASTSRRQLRGWKANDKAADSLSRGRTHGGGRRSQGRMSINGRGGKNRSPLVRRSWRHTVSRGKGDTA